MGTKLNITGGKVNTDIAIDEISDDLFRISVYSKESMFVAYECYGKSPIEAENNADLVEDAHNTYQSTGKLPSELARENDRLKACLKEAIYGDPILRTKQDVKLLKKEIKQLLNH